jgi:hypothetical protein
MNFNDFGLKATMTAAVVAGTMAIGLMPAQAALVAGDLVSFTGDVRLVSPTNTLLTAADTTALLDFLPNDTGSPEGRARMGATSSLATNDQFQIKDLTLTKVGAFWQYINPLGFDWFSAGGVTYKLTSFKLDAFYDAAIEGVFTPDNLPSVDGLFTSQPRMATLRGTVFSSDFEVGKGPQIPTPALLPGLIGLGMTAMRKKRQLKPIAA